MPEETTENTEAQGAEPKGSRKKWVIIGGAVLLLMIGTVVGAWAFGLLGGEDGESSELESGPLQVNEVVDLEPLVVNLNSDRKMAYARIGISLGVYNPEPGMPPFNKALLAPRLKDEMLASVGRMTPSEVLTPETREVLKEQIQAFVNGMLGPESSCKVLEVYFTDFIVQ